MADGGKNLSYSAAQINEGLRKALLLEQPMLLGVEYLTTERYLGKPVYKKAVSIGALPNNAGVSVNITSKSDGTADETIRAIDAHGVTSNGNVIPAPAYSRDPSKQINLQPYLWLLYLTTNFDASGITANIEVSYYKTTD